ncbi:MAG: response regulator [Armatimonadetes bacterium]|nr:response regulator [Akkermansiaceae bacterium]
MRLQKSSAQQQLALDRLLQLSRVLSTLQDIELGHRGYMVSKNDYHLGVYDEARKRFADEWHLLVELEQLDGNNMEELRDERNAAEELIRLAIESIMMMQDQGAEAAQEKFIKGTNWTAMSAVRSSFRARMDEIDTTIRKRAVATQKDFQAGLATSMAMGLLALGIGGISLILLRRVLREMKRSERYALSMVRAKEAKRQKDVFLAMMSHEIRTPLNSIIGFGQLAQQQEMGDLAKRYVKSILEGGRALVVLINDILDLSKLEAGRMEITEAPASMKELLGFMERLFREVCMAKGVKLVVRWDDNFPESLILDAARLRQVMINLIGNAVKFTEKGTVEVIATCHPEEKDAGKMRVRIEVRDTGKGMPEEELEHIYEAFFQSSGSKDNHTQGTGLGLSIVKRFVELMDGKVTVKTKLGEGTVFVLELPNRVVSARLASEAVVHADQVDFDQIEKSVILAVDDNITNLELIKEIFRHSHHEIVTVMNGAEALSFLDERTPDVVLMDLRMPVMDGPTAAREIKSREEFRLLPIVAVTAGSLPVESEHLVGFGYFDSALKKPFLRKDLFDTLAMFLKPAGVGDQGTKPEAGAGIEVSEDLKQGLASLVTEEWEGVKARMVVSEVLDFAELLERLANAEACGALGIYAAKLKEAAESYSFGRMETVIDRFPELVGGLVVK